MRSHVPLFLVSTGLFLGCAGLFGGGGDDTGDSEVLDNAAPTAPTVSIEPGDPAGDEDLELVILAAGEDPDGDEVSYNVRWEVDGADAGITDTVVPWSETNRDEEWTVVVTATDGMAESNAVKTSVTIGNTPPTLGGARISPSSPGSDDVLTCSPTGPNDVDGDSLTYTYEWRVNGNSAGSSDSLPPNRFQVEDRVVCELTPFDGEEYGESATSSTVEIQNGAPSAPEVEINGSGALLCSLVTEAVDLDDHPLTYYARWERDGSSFTGTTQTQSIEGDFVPATQTSAEEMWQCFMWADDGFDAGDEGASQVVEIPSAPSDYYIKQSDLSSNLSNDCSTGGDRPYGSSVTSWSFSWTDEGTTKPNSITVHLGLGVECASSGTRTVSLNGSSIGTYSPSYDCNCSGTIVIEDISSSSTAAYKPGLSNTVTVSGSSSSWGPQENSSWDGGSYAWVEVSY